MKGPTVLISAAAFLSCVLLYILLLGRAPAYLTHDEAFFALTGRSIALTGRDMNGRFMPLYFQWPADITYVVWFQPVPVYVTALFLKVLPVTEWAIRLPTVVVGLTNIVLIYFVAARIFESQSSAIVAAALLALTPAHLIHSRLAMDFLYPLPFVLAWLLCLSMYDQQRRLRFLFAGTSLLGIGFYSYIASIVMMPLYLAATCALIIRTHTKPMRPLAIAAIGFLWPLLFLIPWFLSHPSAVADTAKRYGLIEPVSVAAWITGRLSLYWRYFDPMYLFVAARGFTVNTTHRSGIFLLPLIVCMAVGLNQIIKIIRVRRTWLHGILVFGFASAPLAACLVDQAYAIQRELVILPFGALIATLGLEHLLASRQRVTRAAGWCLVGLILVQFGYFYIDYLTSYRVRSAFGFDGSVREGLEEIIDRQRGAENRPVYLSSDIPYVDWFWRLYLLKHGREDLAARTVYFDPGRLAVESVPDGSLVLVSAADSGGVPLARSADLQTVKVVHNVDQTVCCVILEKASKGSWAHDPAGAGRPSVATP